ncbi:MAG TPA: DUF2059 domain-containing protein [Rhizomicrobium sp.]
MMTICGERDQMAAYFAKLADQAVDAAKKGGISLSDAQWVRFRGTVQADIDARLDDFLTLLAADYAAHYSAADIQAMVDYCQTPLGRKLTKLRAQMEAETYDTREAFLSAIMLSAMQDAQQRIQTKEKGL